MNTYTFVKLAKMGDFDEKYGQAYWGEVNEQLEPVKFNSMNQDISESDTITAEEVLLKTSSKGTTYHQLKKVKVVEGGKAPGSAVQAAMTSAGATMSEHQFNQLKELLEEINERTKKLTGEMKTVGEDPMDLDDIPF